MSEITPISYIKIGEIDHPIDAITLDFTSTNLWRSNETWSQSDIW